jgi:hypothetical protein
MKTIAALVFITTAIYAAEPSLEADRRAILGMSGKFKVSFHFAETLAFQPGYELKKAYDEEAHELVVVAEDTPKRISLQHLLVVGGGHVVHHWRQIWTYEDTRVNEFQGNNSWKTRVLTPEAAAGTWTQLVTQVDNSPRYESWGRWNHEGGAARWVSGDTWRPLPRREHTKRSDYDVVGGINTHILSATGWAHEQANTKLDLTPTGPKAIARESGLNTYTRDDKYDFSPAEIFARESGLNTYTHDDKFDFSPAEKFWVGYSEFSNTVASAWEEVMARESSYNINDDIELSELRDEIKDVNKLKLPAAEAKEKVKLTIAKFIKTPASANAK